MAKKTQGKIFSLRETSGQERWTGRNQNLLKAKNFFPLQGKGGRQKGKQPDSKLNPSYQRHPRKKANSRDLTGNWRKNKVNGSLLLTKDLKSTGEQESSPCDRLPGDQPVLRQENIGKRSKEILLPCYYQNRAGNQRRGKQKIACNLNPNKEIQRILVEIQRIPTRAKVN